MVIRHPVCCETEERVIMKNEYIVSFPLMKSWAKDHPLRGYSPTRFILVCIFFFISICLSFSCLSTFLTAPVENSLFFVFSIIGFFCAAAFVLLFYYQIIWATKRQYKMLSSVLGNQWTRTVLLEDTEIIWQDGTAYRTALSYASIVKIFEKEDYILLVFANRARLRLYRNSFVDCSWQDCKNLLLSKNPNIPFIW